MHVSASFACPFIFSPSSSKDSLGASAAESKALYADIAARKPNTILTLNHETIRERIAIIEVF